MTLIKSLLLGSAAGIVAVASAQAADLPTKKGAPAAQYVKICTITANGKPITGFVLPGSDTCLKISGYITAQMEAGNLKTGYAVNQATGPRAITGTSARPSIGYTTRENIAFDAVSNTAMGPLYSHADIQNENGNGFDSTGAATYVSEAYIIWAGITAGKAESFYSFTGGGAAWANIFSPDQQGFNQPDLLAYTASFGGGFSATLPPQSAGGNGDSGGGANLLVGGNTGIDAGAKFNLPSLGAGDDFLIAGSWTKNAIWRSGIPGGMWGENGAVNGNGQAMFIGDTYSNLNGSWATPTAWSVAATADFHFSPQVSLSPEVAYGQVNWSGTNATSLVSNSKSWIFGAVGHYDPVPGLDFEL